MSKKNKSYPPIPPGKKLIFRQSRTDPRTGATIYARNRPFPIVVDASEPMLACPVPSRPRTPVKRRQLQPSRRQKAAPMQAFPVAQSPRMSPVEVVPPAPPQQPNPNARNNALHFVGACAGGIRAAHQAPANQSAAATVAEVLGGACAGAGATRVSDAVSQALPKEHEKLVGEVVQMVGQHSPELVQALRAQAAKFREERQVESGPDGNLLAELFCFLLEMATHFCIGALNGAPTATRAHLFVVNPTEQNLQRLVSAT